MRLHLKYVSRMTLRKRPADLTVNVLTSSLKFSPINPILYHTAYIFLANVAFAATLWRATTAVKLLENRAKLLALVRCKSGKRRLVTTLRDYAGLLHELSARARHGDDMLSAVFGVVFARDQSTLSELIDNTAHAGVILTEDAGN